jgi:transposase InsO family protein
LFDRICRENGIEHLLTAPRSPTTTGKICEDLPDCRETGDARHRPGLTLVKV